MLFSYISFIINPERKRPGKADFFCGTRGKGKDVGNEKETVFRKQSKNVQKYPGHSEISAGSGLPHKGYQQGGDGAVYHPLLHHSGERHKKCRPLLRQTWSPEHVLGR